MVWDATSKFWTVLGVLHTTFRDGSVRLKLSAGLVQVVGRKSGYSLYDEGLATYSDGDTFDRTAAEGFLKLYSLPFRTIATVQH